MSTVFDHLSTGTPEMGWLACAQLAACGVLEMPAADARLVVLAAHPDDEALGAGGLIASVARAGSKVEVIIATDGEASHPGSPTHSPAVLAALRRVEAAAALAALAPLATLTFLGLPDGGLDVVRQDLVDALRPQVDATTLLVTPWIGDRHPDHEACADAAAEVAAQARCAHWQYPIWAWHWADPAGAELPWRDLRCLTLDAAAVDAKRAALAAYASQHAPLSALPGDEAILPAHVIDHFDRTFETFVVPSSGPPPAVVAAGVVAPVAAACEVGYFDELYAFSDDPWGLQDRFYERRKRALVGAVLPRMRFRRAFEPGCATGMLTAQLAQRCDEVLACDIADRAVDLTRERVAELPHVRVEKRRIPEQWPSGEFDLLVLSEVGYYCRDLLALAEQVRTAMTSDGVVVACHWRHDAPEHPHRAEDVHRALGEGLCRIASHVETDFLLDVWTRSGDSVARLEGIVR